MALNKPLVSILMGTYNPKREHFIAALKSIVQQTYHNIEIIIINDGSTLSIEEMVQEVNDDRIILINNLTNQGLTKCLNQGLAYCKGEFIARMDDDDICEPTRIQEQVAIFLSNDEINVLGSDVKVFGGASRVSHYILKDSREKQQVDLFFNNISIAHPSAMLRRLFLEKYALKYNEAYIKSQDYGLWVDCVQYSKIDCLGKILLNYRVHDGQISSRERNGQIEAQNKIRLDQINRLGLTPNDEDFDLHVRFCEGQNFNDYVQLKRLGKWIRELKKANKKIKYFHIRTFRKELGKKFILKWRDAIKLNFSVKKVLLGIYFLDIFFEGVF